MARGVDQTLAWLGAIIGAGTVYVGLHFLVSYATGSGTPKQELTFDQGPLAKEPGEHDPRFSGSAGHGEAGHADAGHGEAGHGEKAHSAHGDEDSHGHKQGESHSAGGEKHSSSSGDEHSDEHGDEHHSENHGGASQAPAHGAKSSGGDAHWEYKGPNGPEHWGELDESFASCASGQEQSPVNLAKAQRNKSLRPLQFHYRAAKLQFVHNGHTLQANAEDSGTVDFGGETYRLVQFHIHTPSEHQVDGVPSELEIHFVHRNENRQLLVIGVMVDGGGKEFRPIAPLLAKVPMASGEEGKMASIDVSHLLPKNTEYYHYAGSLTTPPCSEGVKWIVLKQGLRYADKQVDALIKALRFNARPVQRLAGRQVYTSM